MRVPRVVIEHLVTPAERTGVRNVSSRAALDWIGVVDTVAGLAHAQDDKDWDRFRQLFSDPVTLDQSAQSGASPVTLTADELTTKARQVLEGFPSTHHASSNPMVRVAEDTATCRTHVIAYHHYPTDGVDFCTMRGFWDLTLTRSGDRWVILRWAVVRTAPWEGDPDLYRVASKGEHRVV